MYILYFILSPNIQSLHTNTLTFTNHRRSFIQGSLKLDFLLEWNLKCFKPLFKFIIPFPTNLFLFFFNIKKHFVTHFLIILSRSPWMQKVLTVRKTTKKERLPLTFYCFLVNQSCPVSGTRNNKCFSTCLLSACCGQVNQPTPHAWTKYKYTHFWVAYWPASSSVYI